MGTIFGNYFETTERKSASAFGCALTKEEWFSSVGKQDMGSHDKIREQRRLIGAAFATAHNMGYTKVHDLYMYDVFMSSFIIHRENPEKLKEVYKKHLSDFFEVKEPWLESYLGMIGDALFQGIGYHSWIWVKHFFFEMLHVLNTTSKFDLIYLAMETEYEWLKIKSEGKAKAKEYMAMAEDSLDKPFTSQVFFEKEQTKPKKIDKAEQERILKVVFGDNIDTTHLEDLYSDLDIDDSENTEDDEKDEGVCFFDDNGTK